jgi:hypothetical protein
VSRDSAAAHVNEYAGDGTDYGEGEMKAAGMKRREVKVAECKPAFMNTR